MTSVHGQYVRLQKSSMPNVWVCLKTMRSQMCERFIKKTTDNPLDFGVHHFCTNQCARPSWSPNLCWMCYLFALHVSCCGRSPWTKFYSSQQHPLLHANRQAKQHISNPAHPWHNNTDTCHITFTSQRIQKRCFRFVFKKMHPLFEFFFGTIRCTHESWLNVGCGEENIKVSPHLLLRRSNNSEVRRLVFRWYFISTSVFIRYHVVPCSSSFAIHPSSFILHPSSFILHPSPFTLHHSSLIIHHSSSIIHHSSLIFHHHHHQHHHHHHHHMFFSVISGPRLLPFGPRCRLVFGCLGKVRKKIVERRSKRAKRIKNRRTLFFRFWCCGPPGGRKIGSLKQWARVFWRRERSKVARRCGAKHISKSKC